MQDPQNIAEKLSRLIANAAFDGPALHLGSLGDGESLDRVLGAIDDTMLPRDVVVSVEESSVTLRVSGRRIRMIVDASADLNVPTEAMGTPITVQTRDTIATLGRTLEALVARPGTLRFERRVPGRDEAVMAAGVVVGELGLSGAATDAAGETDDPEGDAISHFVGLIDGIAIATIQAANDEIEGFTGEQADIEALHGILASSWADFEEVHNDYLPAGLPASMRTVKPHGSEGYAACVSYVSEKQCLALLPSDKVASVAAAWAATMLLFRP